jgi:hypothetical protein
MADAIEGYVKRLRKDEIFPAGIPPLALILFCDMAFGEHGTSILNLVSLGTVHMSWSIYLSLQLTNQRKALKIT